MVHYYWNWAKVNISRLKFLSIKYRLPWKYGESIHLIKSGSEEAMVNNLKCSLVISLWNQSKRAFAANKTKSIFYKRQFIRQFVNMYSETVFISRILFNRRHIYNHWKACLLFWGIFIWVNMERLTVDSLKSKFMEPEFMEPYDLILMISYDGFHCQIKFTIKLTIHALDAFMRLQQIWRQQHQRKYWNYPTCLT